MIDYIALALTHALILLALIRIAGRAELDKEPEFDAERKRPGKQKPDMLSQTERTDA